MLLLQSGTNWFISQIVYSPSLRPEETLKISANEQQESEESTPTWEGEFFMQVSSKGNYKQ
jgi:hypothetical protein